MKTSRRVLFLPPSDAYVRSFLYLIDTLAIFYYTKLWVIQPYLWPQIEFLYSRGQNPGIFAFHYNLSHWDQDHGTLENSCLHWILTVDSLVEGLFLNLRCTAPKCLHNPGLMPHTTQQARQKKKKKQPIFSK